MAYPLKYSSASITGSRYQTGFRRSFSEWNPAPCLPRNGMFPYPWVMSRAMLVGARADILGVAKKPLIIRGRVSLSSSQRSVDLKQAFFPSRPSPLQIRGTHHHLLNPIQSIRNGRVWMPNPSLKTNLMLSPSRNR